MSSNYPDTFEQKLIREYLLHGSIDAVFKKHNYGLPISFANYHRILSKFSVVKSAGPNSHLSESLYFFSLMNNYKLPLERIYHRFAPANIQVSTNTLHRILHHVRLGVTRRVGTALIITTPNTQEVLTGQDMSLLGNHLGRAGDLTIPMGYSRSQDTAVQSITRVLQREVFTDDTIAGRFPISLIQPDPSPIFHINIADIKVAVYHLIFPTSELKFSSFKITNHVFRDTNSIESLPVRPGVGDILDHYLDRDLVPVLDSQFNLNLAKLS